MGELRRDPVHVVVPATSANLGPGFDSAGLALDIADELVAIVSDDPGLFIEVTGEGADEVPRDDRHLVVRAMALGFEALGMRPNGFVLRCTNVIPHGRGMGSSAAAIVGGLVLARAMVVDGDSLLSDDDLMQLALTMEGHPDNIAAALFGGLTFSWIDQGGHAGHIKRAVHREIVPVLAVPGDAVPTAQARSLLTPQVDRSDASFNIARAALLVHALCEDPTLLLEATRDRLHQDARRSMYAASLDLIDRLRAELIPAVISGAGPTVLVLASPMTADRVRELADPAWDVRRSSVANVGAREVPTHP